MRTLLRGQQAHYCTLTYDVTHSLKLKSLSTHVQKYIIYFVLFFSCIIWNNCGARTAYCSASCKSRLMWLSETSNKNIIPDTLVALSEKFQQINCTLKHYVIIRSHFIRNKFVHQGARRKVSQNVWYIINISIVPLHVYQYLYFIFLSNRCSNMF